MGVGVVHGSRTSVEDTGIKLCGVGGFLIDDSGILNVTGCEIRDNACAYVAGRMANTSELHSRNNVIHGRLWYHHW